MFTFYFLMVYSLLFDKTIFIYSTLITPESIHDYYDSGTIVKRL